jgi:predicted HAD superfamily Cof-like phosphohydrolase
MSDKNIHQLAAEFQRTVNEHVPTMPKMLTQKQIEKRIALIKEEGKELIEAMLDEDYNNIAREIADLILIVMGTANAYGMGGFIYRVINEVHACNMAKTRDGARVTANGKVLKPKDWKAPDIEKIVQDYIASFTNYKMVI